VNACWALVMLFTMRLLIASWLMICTLWKQGNSAELSQLDQRGMAVGTGVGDGCGAGISVKSGSMGIW
jgi:hypothetical protein